MEKRRVNELDAGFEQGTSENVPLVTFGDFIEWYTASKQHISAEIRGAKNLRAMRDQYAMEAIGYVQLARTSALCTVKARVTPEHRVHAPAYRVMAIIKESVDGNSIHDCQCLDCPASKGGCKHGLALLHWLISKSSQPSVTTVACYWKKSSLSAAVKYGDSMKALEMGSNKNAPVHRSGLDFAKQYEKAGVVSGTFHMMRTPIPNFISLHEAGVAFIIDANPDKTPQRFIDFLRGNLKREDYEAAEKGTTEQSSSSLWFDLRYGRITASTIHAIAHCHTNDGSLVESIMGAISVPETEAIARGKRLEEQVIRQKFPRYTKCGLLIDRLCPIFGASPDGLTTTHVIEVKCPSKAATVKNYVDGGKLKPKAYSQVQLQMRLAKRGKGFFGVASPNFESDGDVQWVEVTRDNEFIEEVMLEARKFWEGAIFPRIVKPGEKLL